LVLGLKSSIGLLPLQGDHQIHTSPCHAVDFVSKITAEHLATLATADIYTNMVDLALEAKEFNDQL